MLRRSHAGPRLEGCGRGCTGPCRAEFHRAGQHHRKRNHARGLRAVKEPVRRGLALGVWGGGLTIGEAVLGVAARQAAVGVGRVWRAWRGGRFVAAATYARRRGRLVAVRAVTGRASLNRNRAARFGLACHPRNARAQRQHHRGLQEGEAQHQKTGAEHVRGYIRSLRTTGFARFRRRCPRLAGAGSQNEKTRGTSRVILGNRGTRI